VGPCWATRPGAPQTDPASGRRGPARLGLDPRARRPRPGADPTGESCARGREGSRRAAPRVLDGELPHEGRGGDPRGAASGAGPPQLRITKTGDAYLRRLLVGSAHYVLGPFGPDSDLRHWGSALAARGGKNAKKRAVVAVARKLAVLLHRLWVTGAVYEPL